MKSECTINVTSFQYKWRLMVRSYFHRCTLADVFRHRSMSPFIAERYHSDKTWHRWASVDVQRRPMHSDEVWTHHYGVFRLPSFCIGRLLSTLVFCVTTRVMRTNIHNAQSCCERLASADVDRCTAMKSECTIMVNSDFIDVHRSTSANASRSQQLCALWMFVRIARVVPQKTSVDSSRPMQNDGSLNAP